MPRATGRYRTIPSADANKVATAANIIEAAANILNNARTNEGYHYARGTMAALNASLVATKDGTSPSGREMWNDGAIVAFLRTLTECLRNNVPATEKAA